MFSTRHGPRLRAHSRARKSKANPSRGVIKPLPDEISVDWLYKELVDSAPIGKSGAEDFRWEYLSSQLLSKLPMPGVSAQDRRDRAIEKMLETESMCQTLNEQGYTEKGFGYSAEWFNTVFTSAQAICANICGELSDYSLFEKSRFSAGASTSRKLRRGDPYFKYTSDSGNPLHVTPAAYPYGKALIMSTPGWADCGATIKVVPGNRVTTVPKKTDIDRTIAMEPDLNMALQLAVGSHLRWRLKKFGVDLDDQSFNQHLAFIGSRDGHLATIDLSSASDSISYRLVADLLPFDWYSLLDDLRSPSGELPDGKTIVWEKFSSMGNGFTFELETLLFYSLARAAVEHELSFCSGAWQAANPLASTISVYGDDIICHRAFADVVIRVLSSVGFKTNVEKTFSTGPFRESCGKHYYDGVDVTPFYVRSKLDTVQRVIWLLNSIRRWSYDRTFGLCDPQLWELWLSLRRKYVPDALTGGKDPADTSVLCSPGKPKKRLVALKCNATNLGKYQVLLRYFQGKRETIKDYKPWWARVGEADHFEYSSLDDALIDITDVRLQGSIEPQMIYSVKPSLFRLRPNRELWRPIPLFPKELW